MTYQHGGEETHRRHRVRNSSNTDYPSWQPQLLKLTPSPSAGVTGLTSAVFLADAGYDVTVIAAHVPGDSSIEYTSPWFVSTRNLATLEGYQELIDDGECRAGAHWRTSATPAEPMVCEWDVQTFDWWARQLEREEKEEGVERSGLKVWFLHFLRLVRGED